MAASEANCTVAVDAMGGDLGPTEFIRGLDYAVRDLELGCRFVVVGKARLLDRLLRARGLDQSDAISVLDASEIIGMDEKPVQALKRKKDSSMVRGIELVRDGKAQALVSCGNTGALMAGGTLRLRPLEGVERPALAIIIPSRSKPLVLIDVGANPETTAEQMVHNAILGSQYARSALGRARPRVGLLTNGTEEGKGTPLVLKSHAYLGQLGDLIDYAGPIEGFQVFAGDIDVVVCDGFVGNVVLKVSEALFEFIGSTIKEELVRNMKRKIGAVLSKSAFRDMKTRLGPDQHAGAPLLGLRGNILKTHGSANRVAIANALRIAKEIVTHDMIDAIGRDIQIANERIRQAPAEGAT
jgi:glycerol-3-phosphate acyltransferase PlsX